MKEELPSIIDLASVGIGAEALMLEEVSGSDSPKNIPESSFLCFFYTLFTHASYKLNCMCN